MSPILIQLVLVAKGEKNFPRSLKRELEIHKVIEKLADTIEYDVLCQRL
jgi:hypothetical protein